MEAEGTKALHAWDFEGIPLSEEWRLLVLEEGTACATLSGDASRQRDEAEAMAAIYGADFVEASQSEWRLRCRLAKGVVAEMRLELPEDYPSRSAPRLTLDVPASGDLKEAQQSFLDDFVPGSEVAFTWGQRFEKLCQSGAERLQAVDEERRSQRAARLGLVEATAKRATARAALCAAGQGSPLGAADLYCIAITEAVSRVHDSYSTGRKCLSRGEILAENERLRQEAEQKRKEKAQANAAMHDRWRSNRL